MSKQYEGWKLIEWRDVGGSDADTWDIEFEVEAPDGHHETLMTHFGVAGAVDDWFEQNLAEIIDDAMEHRQYLQ